MNEPTVLFFEDEKGIQLVLSKILSLDGYQVVRAENGEKGLEALQTERIDVILLDVMLPGIDGFETCRRIKEQERYQDIPILFLTGRFAEKAYIAKGLSLGADDYMAKPFEPVELTARVGVLLRLKRANDELKKNNEQLIELNNELVQKNEKLSGLVDKDPLTSVDNHRSFQELLSREVDRAFRQKLPLTALLIDIDGFAKITEEFGHAFGDEVLSNTGRLIQDTVRDVDVVARFANDRFAALATASEMEGAYVMAERIRKDIEEFMIISGGRNASITVSIGLAPLPEEGTSSEAQMMERAKAALQKAKASGGNSTCLWTENIHEETIGLREDTDALSDVAVTLVGQSAKAKRVFFDSVKALVKAVEAKDQYTAEHSTKVAAYAVRLGKELMMPPNSLETLANASHLHDIGKIGIPDQILNKPDKLTDEEFALVAQHPAFGFRILKPLRMLDQELPGVLYHHEKYDGTGYPSGKQGEEIPLIARIMAIADTFDTLTSDRSYRTAWTVEEALAEIQQCSGTHYDPKLVELFVKSIRLDSLEVVRAAAKEYTWT